MSIIDKTGLIEHLRGQLKVDWHGLHGISHWTRVRVNGLMLARETGASQHVIELLRFSTTPGESTSMPMPGTENAAPNSPGNSGAGILRRRLPK